MMFPRIQNSAVAADVSRRTLDAILALRTALHALDLAAPEGRDYNAQGPDALPVAMREHAARLESVKMVWAELVAISQSIHTQMTERIAPKTMIRAEWFADGTPATCTCGRSPDCDHVRHAQALGTVRGSVSAVWEEMK